MTNNNNTRFLIMFFLLVSLSSCGIDSKIKKLINPTMDWQNSRGRLDNNLTTIRWPERFLPVVIIAPLSMRSELELSLKNVCVSWNNSSSRILLTYQFEDYSPEVMDKSSLTDGKLRIYFQHDWRLLSIDPASLATTFISGYGNAIQEGDIVFNMNYDFHFTELSNDEISFNEYDIETILLHEIGHLIGLDHVDNDQTSVMNSYLMSGQVKRTPGAGDVKTISYKYN